jgi:2,3-bisphosphoglycerate-dependent phosphoglycerate mutase
VADREPMTRILLFRHAESADPSVFHGAESDIGLSERGHRQAARLAEYLAGRRPDALVCSAMQRARDTAAPCAAACGLEAQFEPALHERRLGGMAGMPTGDREGPWMQTVRRWIAGETSFSLLGAESFDEVRQRVVPAWQRIIQRHAGKTVAVIAHGAAIKVLLLSIVTGRGPADWLRIGPINNVALSELTGVADTWVLERFNERIADERAQMDY